MGRGVFKNFGQGLEWEHVKVQEVCRLLVNGFLQLFLGFRRRGQIADATGRGVVLGKRIH